MTFKSEHPLYYKRAIPRRSRSEFTKKYTDVRQLKYNQPLVDRQKVLRLLPFCWEKKKKFVWGQLQENHSELTLVLD